VVCDVTASGTGRSPGRPQPQGLRGGYEGGRRRARRQDQPCRWNTASSGTNVGRGRFNDYSAPQRRRRFGEPTVGHGREYLGQRPCLLPTTVTGLYGRDAYDAAGQPLGTVPNDRRCADNVNYRETPSIRVRVFRQMLIES